MAEWTARVGPAPRTFPRAHVIIELTHENGVFTQRALLELVLGVTFSQPVFGESRDFYYLLERSVCEMNDLIGQFKNTKLRSGTTAQGLQVTKDSSSLGLSNYVVHAKSTSDYCS